MNATSLFDWTIYKDFYSTEQMRSVFCETGTIEKWVEVERTVSRIQGRLGIIPADAGQIIDEKLSANKIDFEILRRDVEEVGRPIVGLVRQLSEQVGAPHNVWVHYGITTYDILDTGTVLQVKQARPILDRQLHRLREIWEDLAVQHRNTLMIGRTNGQHAQPTTFGARLANWLEEFVRHHKRINLSSREACVVQLGSMVGSLASVYPKGLLLRHGVAKELQIEEPIANWHNCRDGLASLVLNLGLMCASLARIARDVASLSSTDIGEVRETGMPGRGRSSGMPHKRNPRASEFAEGVARLASQRAMGITEIMGQEHERSGGTYIAEWMLVPEVFLLASAALAWHIDLFTRLEIDKQKMRDNVDVTRGMALSEKVTLCLAAVVSKFEARNIVDRACAMAQDNNRAFADVLAEMPEFMTIFSKLALEKGFIRGDRFESKKVPDKDNQGEPDIRSAIDSLLDPSTYTGSAADIVDRAVEHSRTYRGGEPI